MIDPTVFRTRSSGSAHRSDGHNQGATKGLFATAGGYRQTIATARYVVWSKDHGHAPRRNAVGLAFTIGNTGAACPNRRFARLCAGISPGIAGTLDTICGGARLVIDGGALNAYSRSTHVPPLDVCTIEIFPARRTRVRYWIAIRRCHICTIAVLKATDAELLCKQAAR